MPVQGVERPIVRGFSAKFVREAAAHVRAGGHAVVWEKTNRALLVFATPLEGRDDDLGAWSVYDMGKSRWKVAKAGALRGLATTLVPPACHWIVRRRAERDSIHEGPTRRVAFDCTKCAACCKDNEVVLLPEDLERFERGGRSDLTKAPYARRQSDGRVLLTLLASKSCRHLQPSNRCGIYEIRPNACSEFPMGSECCLYAREDGLEVYDGARPNA